MRSGLVRGALAAAALVPVLLAPNPAAALQLLSIRGIELKDNEYVAAFHIETWGVRVRAVCHLPAGWSITVGGAVDPSGTLTGNASAGVAFLERSDLGALDRLFLVDDPDTEFPQHLDGTISIGTYGSHELDWREHPLPQSSYVMEPGQAGCPAP
jgi:hypothetical protein